MQRPAPASRAAASDSDPDLPAAPSTATVGATPRSTYSPTTRETRAGAPQTSMTIRARSGERSSGRRAAIERPKSTAVPSAGTRSERPSQRARPSVRVNGVSESETSVATRSPTESPRRRVGPHLGDGADEHAAGPGDRVLHLAAGGDDVEHLGAHGIAVSPVLLGQLAEGGRVEVERLDRDEHLVGPELRRGVDDGGRLGQGGPGGVGHAVQADRGGRSGAHKNLLVIRHATAVFAAGRD